MFVKERLNSVTDMCLNTLNSNTYIINNKIINKILLLRDLVEMLMEVAFLGLFLYEVLKSKSKEYRYYDMLLSFLKILQRLATLILYED